MLPAASDLLADLHVPVHSAPALSGAGAVLAAGTAAVLVGCGYALGRRTRTRERGALAPDERARRHDVRVRRLETALTVAAAGIATAVAVNGMWHVFGDALGLDGLGRTALAGFLELALLVSAVRARRNLREFGGTGVDGAAVWGLAMLSALLASADAEGLAKAVRLAAPLVAAWLWERGLAPERRRVRTRTRSPIAWRWTRERLAVRFGLADAGERELGDADRSRRLARLTRVRLRLAVLESGTLPRSLEVLTLRPARRALAAWQLQRHTLAAVEHLPLGSDPGLTSAIRDTVAFVVGLRDATAPDALSTSSVWTTSGQATEADVAAPALVSAVTCRDALDGALAAAPVDASVPGLQPALAGAPRAVSALRVPVPEQCTAPDRLTDVTVDGTPRTRDDEELVQEIVDTGGGLPSIRALRRTYKMGQARAVRVHALAAQALAQPASLQETG